MQCRVHPLDLSRLRGVGGLGSLCLRLGLCLSRPLLVLDVLSGADDVLDVAQDLRWLLARLQDFEGDSFFSRLVVQWGTKMLVGEKADWRARTRSGESIIWIGNFYKFCKRERYDVTIDFAKKFKVNEDSIIRQFRSKCLL